MTTSTPITSLRPSLSTTITVTATSNPEAIVSSCTLSPCLPLPTTVNFRTGSASSLQSTTACVIFAEGQLFFAVTYDNGVNASSVSASGKQNNSSSLSGLRVTINYYLAVAATCLLAYDFTPDEGIGARTLNSSGILVVCCMVGEYSFNFTYSGRPYYVTASVQPERVTCVSVDVPSGRVNTTYSQEFQSIC